MTTAVATTKKQCIVKWTQSQSDTNKKYGMLICKTTGLAIDCECKDRVKRGRKAGRACKHMKDHNYAVIASQIEAREVSRTATTQPLEQTNAQPVVVFACSRTASTSSTIPLQGTVLRVKDSTAKAIMSHPAGRKDTLKCALNGNKPFSLMR